MDIVKFIEESKRMCKSYDTCYKCPAHDYDDDSCKLHVVKSDVSTTEKIELVEEWSAAHPRKTRQSEFLKQWPNAVVNEDGVLFCPKTVNTAHFCCCKDKGCGDCRREFWMQEVK